MDGGLVWLELGMAVEPLAVRVRVKVKVFIWLLFFPNLKLWLDWWLECDSIKLSHMEDYYLVEGPLGIADVVLWEWIICPFSLMLCKAGVKALIFIHGEGAAGY